MVAPANKHTKFLYSEDGDFLGAEDVTAASAEPAIIAAAPADVDVDVAQQYDEDCADEILPAPDRMEMTADQAEFVAKVAKSSGFLPKGTLDSTKKSSSYIKFE